MNDSKLRDDVLYAFAIEPRHDRETLERYLRQHPTLAEDLIDLSCELRLDETIGHSGTEAQPDPACQDAWQEFIQCSPAKASAHVVANPFAQFKGQAFVELAEVLQLPRSILAALRDRLPDPDSIPERFVARVAKSMGSTKESFREYLALPPAIMKTLQFKADKKPAPQDRVSFEKLVQSTEMTDEQRQALLRDWGDDGPNRS